MIINYHLIKGFPSFSVTEAGVFCFTTFYWKGGDKADGYKEESRNQKAGQQEEEHGKERRSQEVYF